MKNLKKILVASALVCAFASFFTPPKADAFCYTVRYNYSFGDCILNGEVYCVYCDGQQNQ